MGIAQLHLVELNNSASENTEFYQAFSALSFNRGIIFKKIGSEPEYLLAGVIEKLDREVLDIAVQDPADRSLTYFKRMGANTQIHDLIFELLTHPGIIKTWRYNDDDFFSALSPEFNSKEHFRKIGLDEISVDDMADSLLSVAMRGSCYERMSSYSKSMINAFVKSFSAGIDRVIRATNPWAGEYHIGWFTCFFIIRKSDIVIFGVDDYD